MKEVKMNKTKLKSVLFKILTVLWMVIIFSFSARTGTTSTGDSNHIGMIIGEIVVPEFKDWSEARQMEFAANIDHPIRKTAHAAEYAVLGILFTCSVMFDNKSYKLSGKRRALVLFILPWFVSTLYAASDEIHQLFVPGRSGQVTDVLIDSIGVLIGVFILLFTRRRMRGYFA